MYIAKLLEKDDPTHDLNASISTIVALDVDALEECLPALKQKCEDKLEELLDLKYENIEHIQFTHITKENMYDVLGGMEEYEKENIFFSLMDEIDW